MQDTVIEQQTTERGGRFVRAPVPTVEGEGRFKELVYYASRDSSARFAETVKNSIYKGVQDQGISFSDLLQVYVWLQSDIPNNDSQLQALFSGAQAAPAQAALARAARLATRAGVQSLPAYLIMVDGQVSSIVDATSVPGGSLITVREEVLSRVNKLYKR